MNWRGSFTPYPAAVYNWLFIIGHPEPYGKSGGLSLELLNGMTSGESSVLCGKPVQ